MKLEQISVFNVGLWSGREKKKREIGMARKRAENREGSLGFPGFVKPMFTKDNHHQPQNSTSVAELANRWLDRGSEMSSWVHGNKFSLRCSADSDQRSTLRSVARENLYHYAPTEGCVR
ncbi:hypothetical protein TNCV_4030241 [Trichonephila clavipes]|nr:hypothetical protein TNCV_4030241 [Trichonephila clavipes]